MYQNVAATVSPSVYMSVCLPVYTCLSSHIFAAQLVAVKITRVQLISSLLVGVATGCLNLS